MALVEGKCPNCGGNLRMDNLNAAVKCPYCGTTFLVEKAINNYNVTAEVVNINGMNSPDFDIYNGVLLKYHGKSLHPVIPYGVKEIGEYAFAGVEVEKTREKVLKLLDDNLKTYEEKTEEKYIEWSGTDIVGVDIPDTVTSIGSRAFMNCKKLQEITIPSSVTYVSDRVFENCCGSVILADGFKKVYNGMFAWSKISMLTLPNSIEEIEPYNSFYCLFYVSASFPFTCTVTVKKLFGQKKERRTFNSEPELRKFLQKM